MPKIRIAQDETAYYVGFEPPLDSQQMADLPDPYDFMEGAENAGWPGSAIISSPNATEMVLGMYKASLILSRIKDKGKRAHIEYENCAPEKLLLFLGATASKLNDVAFDTHIYDAVSVSGNLWFVPASQEVILDFCEADMVK